MCVYIHELRCITPWEGFRGRRKGGAGVWLADVLCSRNTGAGWFNEQRETMWTKLPHLLPSHLWWVHFGVSSILFTPLQDKWYSKLSHMESKTGCWSPLALTCWKWTADGQGLSVLIGGITRRVLKRWGDLLLSKELNICPLKTNSSSSVYHKRRVKHSTWENSRWRRL